MLWEYPLASEDAFSPIYGQRESFQGAARPYATVRTSRSDGASSPASVEQFDGRKILAQVRARHRNEEVKEVELSECGGSAVRCSLFATDPYGRYILIRPVAARDQCSPR